MNQKNIQEDVLPEGEKGQSSSVAEKIHWKLLTIISLSSGAREIKDELDEVMDAMSEEALARMGEIDLEKLGLPAEAEEHWRSIWPSLKKRHTALKKKETAKQKLIAQIKPLLEKVIVAGAPPMEIVKQVSDFPQEQQAKLLEGIDELIAEKRRYLESLLKLSAE